MSDVREQPAAATSAGGGAGPRGSFIWYELMTPDADGAKRFYDAVVGWEIGPAAPEFNGYRMIGRGDGGFAGGVLPLTDEMRQHGARPMWLGYVHVANVDSAAAAIEQAGGKIFVPPFDIAGIGRVAMVADPQGAPFYVMKPIPPEGRPDAESDVFSPDAAQRVGWNELQTHDVDAARRFYGEQFGWGSDEFMPMGEMGDYRFFARGGQRIGALFDAGNGQPPHWRFYIRVPSISTAQQQAERLGGTIHMGPHQVPTGEWVIVGSDPQGAEFALVGGQYEETMTDKLVTCLWFDKGEARKAAEFYASVFPDSHVGPAMNAPADFPSGQHGDELTVEFTVLGRPFVGLNGGPNFKPTMAVSFMVLTDSQEETDRYWDAITGNGGEENDCGWCKDKWGYSWQITPRVLLELTNAGGERAKRAFEAMMTMRKIDSAAIEAAAEGAPANA